jgi:hypothetical protein
MQQPTRLKVNNILVEKNPLQSKAYDKIDPFLQMLEML